MSKKSISAKAKERLGKQFKGTKGIPEPFRDTRTGERIRRIQESEDDDYAGEPGTVGIQQGKRIKDQLKRKNVR